MRWNTLAALAVVAGIAVGCGDVLHELDAANELAKKPTGMAPPPKAAPKPGQAPAPGAPVTASKPGAAPPPKAAPGVVAQVAGWLGLGDDPNGGRRPPDPNDPMVICRLAGSTSFMLKSGCLNRRGVVVASKGVPH